MTVNEVADYLSLDPQTVSRKAQSGQLPAFKVGNRWRFDREDIDRWIGEKKTGGNDLSTRVERIWARIRQRAEKSGLAVSSIPELITKIRSEAGSRW
jgi:excisionase family DNA binding protein